MPTTAPLERATTASSTSTSPSPRDIGPPGYQGAGPPGHIGPDPDIEIAGAFGHCRHLSGLMGCQLQHETTPGNQPAARLVDEEIQCLETGGTGDESRAWFVIADLRIECGPFSGRDIGRIRHLQVQR